MDDPHDTLPSEQSSKNGDIDLKETEKKKEKIAILKESESIFSNKKELMYYIIDIVVNGVIIFGLVFLIRYFLISPFQVSGQSMCNTLNFVNGVCLSQQDVGEYIIINKLLYGFAVTILIMKIIYK